MNITIYFSFYVVVLNYKLLLIPYDFFSFKFWYLMARANDLNAFFYLKSELIFKGKKRPSHGNLNLKLLLLHQNIFAITRGDQKVCVK